MKLSSLCTNNVTTGPDCMWNFSSRASGAGQPSEIQKQGTLHCPNRQCFINNKVLWQPQHPRKGRESVIWEQLASLSWSSSSDQKLSLYVSSGSGSQYRINWILRFVWKAFISSSWYNYRAWMLCSLQGGWASWAWDSFPQPPPEQRDCHWIISKV